MKRIVVMLVVFGVLFIAADFFLRMFAERAAARLIADQVSLQAEPDVDLGGFPFLLSVARGRFEEIAIDVESAREGRVSVEDIHLTLKDVEVEPLQVLGGRGSVRAGSLRGRGVISEDTLNEMIARDAPDVQIEVEDGRVLVSRGDLSVPANAVVARNRLVFSAGDVLGPIETPLPSLLPDVRFTSLRAEPDRLVLGVVASSLRIEP